MSVQLWTALAIGVTVPPVFHFLNSSFLSTFLGMALIAWLSVENGANDIAKGIAPLVASKTATERIALWYGTLVTLCGSILSFYMAQKLFQLFSGGLLLAHLPVTLTIVLPTAAGASLWIALATRLALPVSTTHAMIGALVVATCLTYNSSAVLWEKVLWKIVCPLLFSPLLGLAISWLASYFLRASRFSATIGPTMWFTSGVICFARAANDTPKIAAIAFLLIPSGSASFSNTAFVFGIIALAMSLGSLLKGLPVTRLLAQKIVQLDVPSSTASSITAASLILGCTYWGLPVSTTHVSTCAIVGSGLTHGSKKINARVVCDIGLSWILTVPGAGILSGIVYFSLPSLL